MKERKKDKQQARIWAIILGVLFAGSGLHDLHSIMGILFAVGGIGTVIGASMELYQWDKHHPDSKE